MVNYAFEFWPLLEREAVVFQVLVIKYKVSLIKYSLLVQYTDWENDRDGYYYRKIYSEMLGGKIDIR